MSSGYIKDKKKKGSGGSGPGNKKKNSYWGTKSKKNGGVNSPID